MIALALAALLATGTGTPPPDIGAHASTTDESFNLAVESLDTSTGIVDVSSDDRPPTQVIRAPACVSQIYRFDLGPGCINDDPIVETCLDGSPAQNPLWIRTQSADGVWSEWTALRWYTCAGDEALLAAIEREWSTLVPTPGDIALQPNTGWVFATVPTIAIADDSPRSHQATLLGADVEIEATPSSFTWTWGDGESTTTTDPGAAFPRETVTHTYARAVDAATVGLTTTWSGRYRINGGPWIAFDSTITSASPSVTIEVLKPRSRLVDCDTRQTCIVSASSATM